MEAQVILVDQEDREIGIENKLKAHIDGLLHRAFSVFLFDDQGRWLLQQRAADKYHSPNLWTNACCSHPAPGESTEKAAHRRMMEELGMDCPIEWRFHFTYFVEFDIALSEHELDHVFIGKYNGTFNPNPDEIQLVSWFTEEEIAQMIQENPDQFTHWFKLIWENKQKLFA